jgi:uncharacterized protein YutE (UPF0331/DUF86 family)
MRREELYLADLIDNARAAFRNLAVHHYFGVDWAVVWKIAQEEPPLLERQVLAIISAEYPALARDYEPGPDL